LSIADCRLSIGKSDNSINSPRCRFILMANETGEFRLPAILSHSRTRVLFGPGKLAELGAIAKREGAGRVLLVTDPGIVRAGHVERATRSLEDAGLAVAVFDGVAENPTTQHVDAGAQAAQRHRADFLVGLGGGSAMDCAKGINFIVTNGGVMSDYWGVGKATRPMPPMIAVPTTAGTGSEAQSFALIADPGTHQKMACGDVKAACRWAILDPDLTLTPELLTYCQHNR
jgi:alcohol dehydrogenase